MNWPNNGRKIILRFNGELQPIGDGTSLLNVVLGLLGADYNKFLSVRKVGKRCLAKIGFIMIT
ncbi:hypothetical protein AHAS_Ahas11G0161200 [Arachis hypogaea]